MNEKKPRSEFKSAVFTPMLLMVVYALILCSRFLSEETLGLNDNPYLAVVVIQVLTYALPSLFYTRLRGREFGERTRVRPFAPSSMLYVVHASIFLLCGVTLISIAMYTAFPEGFSENSTQTYAAFAMNGRFFDVLYLIVAFAVLPAVTEEYLFRGIVAAEYEKYGIGVAVTMSALTFAMSHFSLERFPVYLFSGIVLAMCMYTTRSVFASAIAHTLNNTFVLLSEKFVLHIADKQNVSFVLFIIIIGAAAVVSAMLMCYEAQSIYKGYAEANVPSDYAPKKKNGAFRPIAEAFFTPTFLIVVIIFVVASITR
ncbi:MAG: CPBP family intramembrane glutamic endopeptidase [Eubacteriales bacterium]|nr:CPBP family intramembrane glutamic endopeptidase [Eubacteriales bacterium]